jgi:hypothetical protein
VNHFNEQSLSVLAPEHDTDIAIIDLDNCISEDKWRWNMFDLHLPIINERYQRYHEACETDLYCNADVIRDLARHHHLIVFTSRPESVRVKTQRWLNRWRIPNIGLFMRPNNNHEPSVPLKRSMYLALPPQLKVRSAIDDRQDILDMYAGEGVANCQRIFIHEPEIIHP